LVGRREGRKEGRKERKERRRNSVLKKVKTPKRKVGEEKSKGKG
jgi:hypothetical protein